MTSHSAITPSARDAVAGRRSEVRVLCEHRVVQAELVPNLRDLLRVAAFAAGEPGRVARR
ncbi:hypothetical protein QFZ67_002640 [Streptomyces sp. V1I1]|nr:hypothetical protein [Streptomyces sp. V1I1]